MLFEKVRIHFWRWVYRKAAHFLYKKSLRDFFKEKSFPDRNWRVKFIEWDEPNPAKIRYTPLTSRKTAEFWVDKIKKRRHVVSYELEYTGSK
jgi:hypothetical protein